MVDEIAVLKNQVEDLKCQNFLLQLKVDSLERDAELEKLKDILKIQNKILNHYEELKSLYQDVEIIFLETDKLIEEIKQIDKELLN